MKGLADALWKLGRTEEAAAMAEKMMWLDPTDEISVTVCIALLKQ